MQPVKKHRVVAVAEKTCSPLVRESSALAFKKGDKIDVQRMTSKDIFVGSVHGRTGSFLAQDVIFFKGQQWYPSPSVCSIGSLARDPYCSQ